jgi:hypothetical protein
VSAPGAKPVNDADTALIPARTPADTGSWDTGGMTHTNTNPNTTITVPSDTTAEPTTRRRARLGLIVAGLAITGLAACGSDDSVTTREPAAAVSDAVRPAMSPDALARWAEGQANASTMSPDAAERWAQAEHVEALEHQARVDEAACQRLSQGLASC